MDEHELLQLIPAFEGKSCVVTPLGGGMTNRNFRLEVAGQCFVLRRAGQDTDLLGIDRTRELACARAAATVGVSPGVVAVLPEHGVSVRPFIAGRVLAEEDVRQRDVLRRVVVALRQYHNGTGGGGRFSPFDTVRRYHQLAQDKGVCFAADFQMALERMSRIEGELQAVASLCPCHNDLLAANFIDDGVRVQIIDWEYAGDGDRFFDLGNLAVNSDFNAEQEQALLEFYFGEVRRDDLRRLRLMRLASDLREATWGFLQSAVSSLEMDFVAYGNKHLERFLASPLSAEFGTS